MTHGDEYDEWYGDGYDAGWEEGYDLGWAEGKSEGYASEELKAARYQIERAIAQLETAGTPLISDLLVDRTVVNSVIAQLQAYLDKESDNDD